MISSLPVAAGIGLKPEHGLCLLQRPYSFKWLEIHPENYMVAGGKRLQLLEKIAQQYPLSFHSVGLSLGSIAPYREQHLKDLQILVERYAPAMVSDHLSWSQTQSGVMPDLLPMPYTQESFQVLVENINRVQDTLNRHILIENPSIYLQFKNQEFTEPDFLNQLCQKTGCGLLLDVNNIYVSTQNQSSCAQQYLEAINYDYVQEIHLAGHSVEEHQDIKLRIDDHGSSIIEPVLDLLWDVQRISGKKFPAMIEWDTSVPDLSVLEQEAQRIQSVIDS